MCYLRDNAPEAAKAKAERVYVEEFRKVIKSKLMKEHPQLSVAAQEREAYSDDRYVQHLEAIREAVEIDEKNRFLREGAKAKLESYQTLSANYRAIKV